MFTSNDTSVGYFTFWVYRDANSVGYAVVNNFDGTFTAGMTGTVHSILSRYGNSRYGVSNDSFSLTQAQADWFNGITPIPPEDNDPFAPGGTNEEGGGNGPFGPNGEDITDPDIPDVDAVSTGFITLFNPSVSELNSLASYMWSGGFDVSTFKKLFANPMH